MTTMNEAATIVVMIAIWCFGYALGRVHQVAIIVDAFHRGELDDFLKDSNEA